MNIYSLYVTITNYEREYFEYLITFIKKNNFKNVIIVNLDFHYRDRIDNLKLNKKDVKFTVYRFAEILTISKGFLKTFDQIISLYQRFDNNLGNFFMYSGHSNGMYLGKRGIRILRIDDFCELAYRVVGKRLDILGFDCCLCGNINCLSTCYTYTKYIIASSGYWAELSMLQTRSLYTLKNVKDIKNIVLELSNIEIMGRDNYVTDYCIYEINSSLLELIKLTLKYKDYFKTKNSVIDNYYYKDLECCFRDLGVSIKNLLDKFVIYSRFEHKKCYSVKKSKNANKSFPSQLSIITKRPMKNGLFTFGDIFLSSSFSKTPRIN